MDDRDDATVLRRSDDAGGQLGGRPVSDPGTWVGAHGDVLFRYALLRVRDSAVAEDLVQETFLAAYKAKNDFQGGSEERTWFIGILRHKIADHFRKDIRATQTVASFDADPLIENWFDRKGRWRHPPRDWDVDPAKLAERSEFLVVLQNCMDTLPDHARAAFTLRVVENNETDEVCRGLGITDNHLWVLLHRARARLRACLDAKWFGRQPEERTRC